MAICVHFAISAMQGARHTFAPPAAVAPRYDLQMHWDGSPMNASEDAPRLRVSALELQRQSGLDPFSLAEPGGICAVHTRVLVAVGVFAGEAEPSMEHRRRELARSSGDGAVSCPGFATGM